LESPGEAFGLVTVPTRSRQRTYERFRTFPRDGRPERGKREGYAGATLEYTLADHVKS